MWQVIIQAIDTYATLGLDFRVRNGLERGRRAGAAGKYNGMDDTLICTYTNDENRRARGRNEIR